MNFLQLPAIDRPALPVRERIPGRIEVRCPACGQWRPGFTLQPTPPGSPTAWHCDSEISANDRNS